MSRGLQIHLGAAETREKFDEAMQKLDRMNSDFEPVKEEAEESTVCFAKIHEAFVSDPYLLWLL